MTRGAVAPSLLAAMGRTAIHSAWFWYLAAGTAVVGGSVPLGPARVAPVLAACAAVTVLAGIRRRRPAARTAWTLIAVALAASALSLTGWVIVWQVTGRPAAQPSIFDALHMGCYLMFAAGLAAFVRRRIGQSPWEGVLAAGILALGMAAVVWAFVFDPLLDDTDLPAPRVATVLAYPLLVILVLAMFARLVITTGLRTWSMAMLGAAVVLVLASDTVSSVLLANHGEGSGNVVSLLGWDLCFVLFGAAALHPSMRHTAAPIRAATAGVSQQRLLLYLSVVILVPTVAIAQLALHRAAPLGVSDVIVPLALSTGIAILLVFRLDQIAVLAVDRAQELGRQATELDRSQQLVRAAHERSTAIFESAPIGMAQLARDGTVLAVNAALVRFIGYPADDLVGHGLARLAHPAALPVVLAALNGLDECENRLDDTRSVHADGSTRWAQWVLSPVHTPGAEVTAIAVIADRTEARQLEIELRHGQKLEAIGRLAAGVAHELNTPIQFIGDNVGFLGNAADRLLTALGATPTGTADGRPIGGPVNLAKLAIDIPDAVRETQEGVDRVATIVQALKSFARRSPPEHEPADINQALADTLTVARGELRNVGMVTSDLHPLPPVCCSIGDINQVVLNLLVNAADAVYETQTPDDRGRITMRCWPDEDHVVIEVTDSGPGIPDELREHVFEPFFTTKPVGQGSGQGLALARTVVVNDHGGTLDFTSTPGHGTTFTVRLPVAGHTRPSPRPPATSAARTTGSRP